MKTSAPVFWLCVAVLMVAAGGCGSTPPDRPTASRPSLVDPDPIVDPDFAVGPQTLPTGVVAAPVTSSPPGGSLVIQLAGVRGEQGAVRIAVYSDEESFRRRENPLHSRSIPAAEAQQNGFAWRVDQLPAGQYALAAYHDRNDNGQLDKNGFGMPIEPYGFSGENRSKFRPPSHAEAKVDLREAKMHIEIELR